MEKAKANQHIEQLAQEIEEHNYRYYVLSQPVVSDTEYDRLFKKLIDLENQFPEYKSSASPSQRVGTKLPSGIPTVRHMSRMYSLNNTYSVDELKQWHHRVIKGLTKSSIDYAVELKMDGVSAALSYDNGEFVLGATRGDGFEGEDVTHCLKTIRSIPLKLKRSTLYPVPRSLEVCCEIYMNKHDFSALNIERQEMGEQIFINPRNATSGSIKLLDSRITARRRLNCFVHSPGTLEGGKDIKTQSEFLEAASSWGFCINENWKLCKGLDEVIDFCSDSHKKRDSLAYEVDGVVVKVNSFEQQRRLGATMKSPRWAVAFKFPAYQATTTVKDIVIQVGRTGILTPVAFLEPIECAGVTISRSTLHNFDEVKRLGIKVGDRVLIERAGDVIPKVVKVVVSSRSSKKKIGVPRKCPVCGGGVIKEKQEDVAYRCNNPSCPRKIERGLIHFAARPAMDIEGLGDSVVAQLIARGLVRDFADIYALKKENLMTLELFADKKAENLLKQIEASKGRPLGRLLFALGISNVGEKAAEILADRYGTIDEVFRAGADDLQKIPEVGPVIASSVEKFFQQSSTRALIEKFKRAGVNLQQYRQESRTDKLKNKKFIFTGELKSMTRHEAAELVKQGGGEVASGISKTIDYVVVGEDPGSKNEKAQSLGLKILTEQQFLEVMNDASLLPSKT